MIDSAHAASTPERRWLKSQLLPAVLGIGIAVLLGGTGFGLGTLYARLLPVTPVAVAAVVEPRAVVPRVPAADAVGGPEETVVPAIDASPPVAAASSADRKPSMTRPVRGGWISSRFGQRTDPFTGKPAVHRGLDFAGLDNSAILAVAPGVVSASGRQRGYGNYIEIDHGRGWVTRYGHNAFNLVEPGDYVKAGQTIALMGSTGRATGTHLHFEVLYLGRHQNPARFVARES